MSQPVATTFLVVLAHVVRDFVLQKAGAGDIIKLALGDGLEIKQIASEWRGLADLANKDVDLAQERAMVFRTELGPLADHTMADEAVGQALILAASAEPIIQALVHGVWEDRNEAAFSLAKQILGIVGLFTDAARITAITDEAYSLIGRQLAWVRDFRAFLNILKN